MKVPICCHLLLKTKILPLFWSAAYNWAAPRRGVPDRQPGEGGTGDGRLDDRVPSPPRRNRAVHIGKNERRPGTVGAIIHLKVGRRGRGDPGLRWCSPGPSGHSGLGSGSAPPRFGTGTTSERMLGRIRRRTDRVQRRRSGRVVGDPELGVRGPAENDSPQAPCKFGSVSSATPGIFETRFVW